MDTFDRYANLLQQAIVLNCGDIDHGKTVQVGVICAVECGIV